MAHKKHFPDSSPPSSLPPETAGIDLNWDDDATSVGTRSAGEAGQPPSEEVDMGDRITAVPDIPISELNARLWAEAERATEPPPSLAPTRPGVAATGTRQRGDPSPLPVTVVPPAEETVPPLPDEPPPLLVLDQPGLSPDSSPAPIDAYRPTEPAPPSPRTLDLDEVGHEEHGNSHSMTTRPTDPPEPEVVRPTEPVGLGRLRRDLRDRYAVGDFSGALATAERLLACDAQDADALRYAESCREVLLHMLTARVGSLDRVVKTVVAPDQIRWLSLDHRAGFFLSLVDGMSTAEELLDISGMTRLDALRILSHLLEQRVVAFEPVRGRE
jgi:hypothetical protein